VNSFRREDLEQQEEERLAPYAAKSGHSLGRQHPESEHPLRTAFQRDRDRIVHSSAFRRLEYKTQVFINHEGDHYRTRLTHSMEAAQIARTTARALLLNEDLCETLALGHDLGHPPFGHSGEEALRECMKEHGGFEHNLQGLRVLDCLEERYTGFRGLNLTFETRESMRKHTVRPDYPLESHFRPDWAPLLEAQVVDHADSVAYDAHDIDDALHAGILSPGQLDELDLWRQALESTRLRYEGAPWELQKKAIVRTLIDIEVTDLITTTASTLNSRGISSIEAVRSAQEPLVRLSPEIERRKRDVQQFLFKNVYRDYRVIRMQQKAKRFLTELFRELVAHPDQMPPKFQSWAKEVGVPRGVADYIAGMTDRYAQDEYRKLFSPFENLL
jgi:dGTPase